MKELMGMVQSANAAPWIAYTQPPESNFLPLSRLIPQTFAEKDAVHCGSGCSALRLRWSHSRLSRKTRGKGKGFYKRHLFPHVLLTSSMRHPN